MGYHIGQGVITDIYRAHICRWGESIERIEPIYFAPSKIQECSYD